MFAHLVFGHGGGEQLFTLRRVHAVEAGPGGGRRADAQVHLGGAGLAARYNGLSADHVEYATEEDAAALAGAGTIATLLPGAFYTLRETQLPPIDALREHGVPMALGTDANPGSSPALSLLLMLNMACTLFRLTPEEALRGVTAAPKHLLLGGCLVAFYVLSVTYVAPVIGVGNAVFFVLLGQLLSAAAIDHFGLFGAQVSPLGLTRSAGLAVMALGVWITQQA